jgi:hypothetical protein
MGANSGGIGWWEIIPAAWGKNHVRLVLPVVR